MIEEYVMVHGYWKDSKEPFERLCKVDSRMNPNHKDHQAFIDALDDDPMDAEIFYYFEPAEHIIGDHGDMVIYKFEMKGLENEINY